MSLQNFMRSIFFRPRRGVQRNSQILTLLNPMTSIELSQFTFKHQLNVNL